MKMIFSSGDKKIIKKTVLRSDQAEFETGVVHEVCSTFAIARDMEWATRQFVLEMREADEEGIGTFVNVKHQSPALIGEELTYTAFFKEMDRNELICNVEVTTGGRVIATGLTGQKILKREKLKLIFDNLKQTNG
jgi:fluoroacetyl-CoA thioesterase